MSDEKCIRYTGTVATRPRGARGIAVSSTARRLGPRGAPAIIADDRPTAAIRLTHVKLVAASSSANSSQRSLV